MNSSSNRLLFLSSLALLLLLSSAAKLGGGGIVGGYQPIANTADPYIVEIAKFAVAQHNADAKDDLVFVKVASGFQQVVAGMNYKLSIVARHGDVHGGRGKYVAVVYDRAWDKYRSLTSFQKA